MKTKSIIILILFIGLALPAICQGPAFNGQWKINKEKSTIDYNQIYLAKINISLKSDSIFTTRFYMDPNGQEYPFDENLALNGNESTMVIFDMPRVTKAQKSPDGGILIESKTTFSGEMGEDNLVAKESWKTAEQGKTLVFDFTNVMSGQEMKGIFYFVK